MAIKPHWDKVGIFLGGRVTNSIPSAQSGSCPIEVTCPVNGSSTVSSVEGKKLNVPRNSPVNGLKVAELNIGEHGPGIFDKNVPTPVCGLIV